MKKTVFFFLALVGTIGLSSPSLAEGIQMLPPLQSDNTNQTCLSGQGSKVLTWDGTSSIKCQKDALIDSNGQVGIGTSSPQAKLDVNGGVRVGSTTVCTAGTLRYNSSQSRMEYCNGSSWLKFATGPSFGGIFQTYLCTTSGVFKSDGSAGCRRSNPVTGSCSCPSGYTRFNINDYDVPVGRCPQTLYENRGMRVYGCIMN
ncbi:MAG: hypothetical protein AB7E52_02975 [Bdellovibrionales bacterium]